MGGGIQPPLIPLTHDYQDTKLHTIYIRRTSYFINARSFVHKELVAIPILFLYRLYNINSILNGKMKQLKYFSTFTGIGGFELGIQQAYERNQSKGAKEQVEVPQNGQEEIGSSGDGHNEALGGMRHSGQSPPTCVGYSEIDKYAIQIFKKHYPELKNYGDITKINWEEVPDFDLFVGGFPCQAFSIAGKRKGFEDTRGTLFFDIAEALKVKQPNLVVLENVKGLMSHDKGKTLEVILESLQELGYYVNIEVYNSKNFGVPQNRERIIFICRHIKTLISDGENLNLNTSRQIIEEFLFQILLNNLVEVKKLQEQKSKDWVIGYLLSKEINEKHQTLDTEENTKGGITIPTAESKSLFEEGEVWQNIDTWLSNKLGEDLQGQSKSTTLTAIKKIIESKTYNYSQMHLSILLVIAHLRSSSESLWNEILSNLIVIKENTEYARINDKKEEVVISETGNAYLTTDIQKDGQFIAFGHLRGTSRPQVFPFGESDKETYGVQQEERGEGQRIQGEVSKTNGHSSSSKGGRSGVRRPSVRQLNQPTHSNDRVYGTDGLSPTLNTVQGGNRQPFIPEDTKIRRLTPTECERLQGFPDGWTAKGINENGEDVEISDTQRYKSLGNAVTVNVIKDIMERLL